jgi:hypothetical protein
MTAAEAMHKANIINEKFRQEQYERLKLRIIQAVDLGCYRIGVNELIQDDVKQKFEYEGFKVLSVAPPYESVISWNK